MSLSFFLQKIICPQHYILHYKQVPVHSEIQQELANLLPEENPTQDNRRGMGNL
jgi:hypothetical protein